MTLTCDQASKAIRELNDKIYYIRKKIDKGALFRCAMGEDIEELRPKIDLWENYYEYVELEKKIVKIKHAINVFNTTTVVEEFNMTIDELLVYIPQLNAHKARLGDYLERMPRERAKPEYGEAKCIDYICTNYNNDEVQKEYDKVFATLNKAHSALDRLNNTLTFEVDI